MKANERSMVEPEEKQQQQQQQQQPQQPQQNVRRGPAPFIRGPLHFDNAISGQQPQKTHPRESLEESLPESLTASLPGFENPLRIFPLPPSSPSSLPQGFRAISASIRGNFGANDHWKMPRVRHRCNDRFMNRATHEPIRFIHFSSYFQTT